MPEPSSYFISCCPADNAAPGRQWADWLGKAIADFVVPPGLPPIAARPLEESGFLVVICSPGAVGSQRVADDIRWFKESGKAHRILAVIIDGEPNAPDKAGKMECLPEPLRFGVTGEDEKIDWKRRAEPIALDLRPGGEPGQGWTAGAAYREELKKNGATEREAVVKAAEYAQGLEQAKMKVISGILGVPINFLQVRGALRRPSSKSFLGRNKAPRSQVEYEPAPSAASIPDAAKDESKPRVYDENVQFTVYRPKVVAPGKWHTLLAFAHLSEKAADARAGEPDPLEEVARQAKQILADDAGNYGDVTQESGQAIPRRGEITFMPEAQDIEFNPRQRSFLWEEPVHREEFRLRVKAGLMELPKTVRGKMTVFLGAIIVAEIPMTFRIDREADVAPAQNTEESHARPYRKIFTSYSHKDSAIVEQITHYAGVSGDEYLRDALHLRTGQEWNAQLLQMIDEADIFQLFWSSNSMRSPYVRQEWEHALSLNRPNFIRPTYWEEPFPAAPRESLPPPQLGRLHFQKIRALTATAEKPPAPPMRPPSSAAPAVRSNPAAYATGAEPRPWFMRVKILAPAMLCLAALVAMFQLREEISGRKAAPAATPDPFALKNPGTHGLGAIQDYARAEELFEDATDGDTVQMRMRGRQGGAPSVLGDGAEKMAELQAAADEGDADAQVSLGWTYAHGLGVPRSYARAIEYFQKAADQGNAEAQYRLGWLYEFGLGTAQNRAKAAGLFQKAADKGYADAQYNLGWLRLNGLGVIQSYTTAAELWRKAADAGNAGAQASLGLLYAKGTGVAQSYAKAAEQFQKAAGQDNADAQYNLGVLYGAGAGVGLDYARAAALYQQAAGRGNAAARNNLGVLYANGQGVEKDAGHARELFEEAAAQGDDLARENLANLNASNH